MSSSTSSISSEEHSFFPRAYPDRRRKTGLYGPWGQDFPDISTDASDPPKVRSVKIKHMRQEDSRDRQHRQDYCLKVDKMTRKAWKKKYGKLPTSVERITMPTREVFIKKYVAMNKPCIITDAVENWPALKKWNMEYLADKMGDAKVDVNVMPCGGESGTSVGRLHVDPMPVPMKFTDFVDVLSGKTKNKDKDIYYISGNGNNFTKQFKPLQKDVKFDFPFAKGASIKSVNLWMGGHGCKSPIHNDYDDNLYVVLAGKKMLRLWHPLDSVGTYATHMRGALYKKKGGKWTTKEKRPIMHQHWCTVNADKPDLKRHPLFARTKPIEVVIEKGEVLFLPTHWFHHVTQEVDDEGKAIAVNFWLPHRKNYPYLDLYNNSESVYTKLLGERFEYEGTQTPTHGTGEGSSTSDSVSVSKAGASKGSKSSSD